MSDETAAAAFPRDAYLELLQAAGPALATAEGRVALMSGLDVLPTAAIDALVESLADPSRLDVALTLARRVAAEVGAGYDAAPLLATLETLYREQRAREVASTMAASEAQGEWMGFECVHYYSLTDRFFGREAQLADLDAWLTPSPNAASVRCLAALGGSGKSALAWHWLNRAFPTIRQLGYRGAFWCSFYEKDFDFSDFLRRALAFCTGVKATDVAALSRSEIENQLIDVLRQQRFVFVLDGLERLMNGYAVVFDRAIDPESIQRGKREEELTAQDRRLTDPRSGAVLRRLAGALASKVLITTRLGPADLEDPRTGEELPHADIIQLAGLDPHDAVTLWKSINPNGQITGELQAVFVLTKYHPLVISILARSVAACGGSWNDWRRMEAHRDFDPGQATTDAEIRAHIIGICVRDLQDRSYDVLGVLTTSGKPMPLELLSRILIQGSAAGGDDRWTTPEQVAAEIDRLVSLGFVGAADLDGRREFDVHPVVRGAAWKLITDPGRERFLSHALSEFFATPDRQEDGLDLNTATSLFQLLVQSQELDRAWDMYLNKLWWPLTLRSDNRALVDLFELMLPHRDPLQLLPLTSRREQGNATQILGSLLMTGGEGRTSDKLHRWSGAIRLQIGDFTGFLDARHSRSWQTMYEGRLFETELDLRGIRADAIHFQAPDILPFIDCWIGIVLALRGEREEARRYFDRAERQTPSYRWWAQGVAEGYIYLNDPDQALAWLSRAADVPLHPNEGRGQLAWERVTRGIAFTQKEQFDQALDELSGALEMALRANYAIIQCFALPRIAEIFLRRRQMEAAEAHIDQYFRVDPESRYRLSATDAWRVRALCRLSAGQRAPAVECAVNAYRLAACDGPPFVYRQGLQRAIETLAQCGAYVPHAEARLPPDWRPRLSRFAERPAHEPLHSAVAVRDEAPVVVSVEEARALLRQSSLMREASERDRRWWEEITREAPSGLEIPLAEAMASCGITLETFRSAYERSEYKSVLVVFHSLHAESIVGSQPVRLVGALDDAARSEWLGSTAEHQSALNHFLGSGFAKQVEYTFVLHDFDKVGTLAFLQDNKRRMGYGPESLARTWWDQLEQARPAKDMLVLSEAMALAGVQLEELVRTMAIGTPRGLEYAFAAIRLRRAIDELKVDAISKTDGWTEVQVFLRLEDVKQRLGWRQPLQTSTKARELWAALEQKHRERLAPVLRIAEELAIRRMTIEDYYRAYLHSSFEDAETNLAFVEYTRLKVRAWDGTPPQSRPLSDEATPFAFSNTTEWLDERVNNRLDLLKTKLQFAEADARARDWWLGFEGRAPARAMLRIAEELDIRQASLNELFKAAVDGGALDNIAAALAFLDFSRAKEKLEQQARSRAFSHSREGTAHSREGRYRSAIESFEAAIREYPNDSSHYTRLADAWEQVTDIDRSESLGHAIDALERGVAKVRYPHGLRNLLTAAKRRKRLADRGAETKGQSAKMLPVVTPIAVEVASDLIPLVEKDTGVVLAATSVMRERILNTTGVAIPGVRFRGNEGDLPAGNYIVMLDEIPLLLGSVDLRQVLMKVPAETLTAKGVSFNAGADPFDDTPAHWVSSDDAVRVEGERLDAAGYLVRHLERVLRVNLASFVTEQSVGDRLDAAKTDTASDIAKDRQLLSAFTRVLKALVEEGMPTTAFEELCAAFLANARAGGDVDAALQAARALPEVLPHLRHGLDGKLYAISDEIERLVREGLHPHGDERLLALLPEPTQEILSAVRSTVTFSKTRSDAVVVEDGVTRRYVRRLLELEFPYLAVLARAELDPADTRPMTTITLD